MDDEAPSINGWSPPLIHDWSAGTSRLATQEDVDALLADRNMLHRIIGTVRREFRDGVAQGRLPATETF